MRNLFKSSDLSSILRSPLSLRCKMIIRSMSKSDSNLYLEQMPNGVAILSMNNAASKNAFSKSYLEEFISMTIELSNMSNIRALVLKSAVPKVFCAGADLKERVRMNEEEVDLFVTKLRNAVNDFSELPFPTIAAIEGVALGGGLELALACDLRYATSGSLIGLPECALAIIPGAGGSQRLPRVVGLAKAKELIFTARRMNGDEAAKEGVINGCVENGAVVDHCIAIAGEIATKGPVGIRMAKAAIDNGISMSLSDALVHERECYGATIPTSDRLEGLKAFLEKRPPVYTGK